MKTHQHSLFRRDGFSLVEANNPFNGAFFGLPEMSPEERLNAQTYLSIDTSSETLIYNVNVIP